MEDIILIDSEQTEYEQIDVYDPVSENKQDINDIEKSEKLEEESINEREQIDKSDNIILGSNDINNLRSSKIIDLKNYDSVLLWANDNPNSTFVVSGSLQLNDDVSNYEYLKIDYYNKNNGNSDDYISLVIPREVLTTANVNSNYINNTVVSGVYYGSQYQIRGYLKGYNDNTKLSTFSSYGTNIVPIRIYGLNESTNIPEPSPSPNPSIPSVSGNTVNNYYITVSSNDASLSYNLLNKPLNNYSVSESILLFIFMGLFVAGFSWFIKKNIFKL